MEILSERFLSAEKALGRFEESLARWDAVSDLAEKAFYRDSVVQRFEFTYEAFWKFLRAYLGKKLMVDTSQMGNARLTFRAAHAEALLSAQDLNHCLTMLEDRNQTSHTYDEVFAQELADRARQYAHLMRAVMSRALP